MDPVARTLAPLCLLAALVGTAAPSGPAQGQPPVLIDQARFVDPPAGEVTDGRLHLTVAIMLHSGGLIPSIDSVQWNNGGVDVRVSARWPSGFVQPAFTEATLPLTIDNLRSGSYPLRLWSHTLLDQFEIVVPATRGDRFPLELRIWPQEPTPFDSLWVLVDRWNQCHQLQPTLSGTRWTGGLTTLVRPCSGPVHSPRLATVALAPQSLEPESVVLHLPGFVRSLRLRHPPYRLNHRLTPRLNGSWFDPAQSGHGINVEVVDRETLLVQWLTFDADGNRLWIVGAGVHEGASAVLQAHTVSGGRFPPQFDPSQAQAQLWGTIGIEFLSCTRARMDWQRVGPGAVAGSMPLHRLVGADGSLCAQPPPESALEPAWYQGPGSYFRLPDPG